MYLWLLYLLSNANFLKVLLFIIYKDYLVEIDKELEDIISKHYLKTQNIPFVSEYDFIDLKALKEKGFLKNLYIVFSIKRERSRRDREN